MQRQRSDSSSNDDNRFTLTDYEYERSEGDMDGAVVGAYPYPHAESSKTGRVGYSDAQLYSHLQEPSGNRTLRLHQHQPTTASSGGRELYLPYSTSVNELVPLPSVPQSLNSSHPLETTNDLERGQDRDPFDRDHRAEEDMNGDRRSILSEFPEKRADVMMSSLESSTNSAPRKLVGRRWYQRIIPSTLLTKLLLVTILIETVIDLTIEGNILYRFNEEVRSSDSTDLELENKRRLPIYLIIFGLAHLWQIVLTTIAIRTKNTIQVVAVTLFNFAFLGYAVIQIYELRQILGGDLATSLTGEGEHSSLMTLPLNVLTALIIAVVALTSVILVILSFFLQREFGWQRYRFLGADLMIREYYTRFQVFECICYFSAFFCAGFGIQFIWLVLNSEDPEYYITWIAFPLLLIILIVGRFAAKYENSYCMTGFMAGLVAGCAYFIFKLVRIWQSSATTYAQVAKSLTTFDALSLALLVLCMVWGAMVWRNFGEGLKQAVLSRPGTSTIASVIGFWRTGSIVSSEAGVEKTEMAMAQRRISID